MRRFLILVIIFLGATVAQGQAPGVPTGFAVAVTGQRADLSWTNPGTQTYTIIERQTGAEAFTEIYNALSFVERRYDVTVLPSITYGYRIRACNASGCSANTSVQTAAIGAAPTATGSITLSSSTAIVGEVILIDARASTNFCKRPQPDGSPSITLTFGDTDPVTGEAFKTNLLASGHAYMWAGSYTVRLNGKNCSGVAASEVTASVTVSARPACTTTQTLTDSGNAVTNATNLDAAIDAAKVLNTGVAYPCINLSGSWSTAIQGPIMLDVPSGNNWIRIYWSGLTVPHLKRVFPADFPATAPIILNKTAANEAAITTGNHGSDPSPATHHYILEGLHLKRDSAVNLSQALMYLGQTSANTVAKLPHHIIVDRCFFNGGTGNGEYSKDGLNVVGDFITVKDSYFAEFKREVGADPTGMSVSGGQGPVAVWNNEFIADGENYSENNSTSNLKFTGTVSSPTTTSATLSSTTNLAIDDQIAFVVNGFPGAAFSTIVRSVNPGTGAITFDAIDHPPDNASTATWETINSFLEFRRNYLHKLLRWKVGELDYVGIVYLLKNLWETKSGRYHVLQGNYFRYNWYVYQPFAIVIGSACAECGLANTIREFDISNNVFRDMNTGINITSSMPSGGRDQSQANSDFHLRNNLNINVGSVWNPTVANQSFQFGIGMWWGGAGQVVTSGQVLRAFVLNSTFDNGDTNDTSGPSLFTGLSDVCSLLHGSGAIDSLFYNNAHQDGGYGFFNQCGSNFPSDAFARFFQPGDTTTHTKNLVVNLRGHTYAATDITTTGWTDEFVNYTNKDFTLVGGSLGKNAGTDNADVGANITNLRTAIGASSPALGTVTSKTESGNWAASMVCAWHTAVTCN